MSREVTFVHLTDLHIGDPAVDDHLFSNTQETLKQVLALVATIEPRPSFLVASGDLANRGDAESYAILRQIMQATDLPVVYAIGNHDTREGFYAGMGIETVATDAPLGPRPSRAAVTTWSSTSRRSASATPAVSACSSPRAG